MIEFVVNMPKEELLNRIDKITNKYKVDIAYGMTLKTKPELVGDVNGDVFWLHKVMPGACGSMTAFYGVAYEYGNATKIKGVFKIIPETKIMIVLISILMGLIIFSLSCMGGFSFNVFFKLTIIYIIFMIFIIGIMCLMSRIERKPLMKILNNLGNYDVLKKLINDPMMLWF